MTFLVKMMEQAVDLVLLEIANLQLHHLVELSHVNHPVPIVVASRKHSLRGQLAPAVLDYTPQLMQDIACVYLLERVDDLLVGQVFAMIDIDVLEDLHAFGI